MQFQISTIALLAATLVPRIVAVPTADFPSNGTLTESTAVRQYCVLNYHYCGWNLIENHLEDYRSRISSKLCSKFGKCDPGDKDIWNSLWNCGADLEFLGFCGGDYSCVDGGAASDYCRA
ncbi:hypothetical protein GLAREA_09009 [Glarea lozoyensis ATCC 20868]|uniref:Uncharacterized protein n=1 Tax=Glarea lozoyensis (strain ATCC 20868 / MF5171) TaxID=1116229 RepID=S3DY61_GLAL2|nr:uncharacterized protein GLAREA_09009 [Glarea lozoyensis ATCC 20868]EPE36846.1 hypothetical protein GLAREA_09009 [Glarea lozoyensis ATCC 20868]